MIFNILIIAAIGGIAYFHYAQGFFSATISTICAIIAAVLAVSYHEALAAALLGGKMADYANSVCLVAIFGIVYILLRVLMDKAVPGNIRLPVIVDRVGGAILGVIAAIFTAGVFALAGAALPFGPAVYARWPLETREEVTIPPNPGQSVQTTADVNDQMAGDNFDLEGHRGLWIPADDLLLGAVQGLSNGGSLAGDRTLRSIHPSYADELFAQRLGIQVGANHVSTNLPGKTQQVTVPDPGVFRVDTDLNKSIVDAEMPQLHQRGITSLKAIDPSTDKMQLVVRVLFEQNAADADRMVRLAPASIRLCANERNYYPVGTLENGLVYANKVDDFLLLNLKEKDGGADFVFLVNPSDITTGDPKAKVQKINDGVFLEAKRMARVDLSGKEIQPTVPAFADNRVERKPNVSKNKKGGGGAESSSSAAPDAAAAAAGPFVYSGIAINKHIFSPINTGTADKDAKNVTIPSGTLSLQSGQFTLLDINTTQTLVLLKQGSYALDELFEPTGKKLIQIQGAPPAEGGDPWAWGTLRNYTLVDAAGKTYAPCGGWAQVKKDQQDRMVAKFDANATQPPDVTGSADDGRPLKVWIAFLVPSGTHLKSLNVNGKPAATMEQMVP